MELRVQAGLDRCRRQLSPPLCFYPPLGDSLTGEMIDTLRAVLRAKRVKHVHLKMDTYTACNGALTLSWYRNDFLDTRLDGFETPHCEEPDFSISQCMVFAGMYSSQSWLR